MMETTSEQLNNTCTPPPVPRKIRGTLTIKAEDDMEFRAERKTGISSQQELSRTSMRRTNI
jgi:hypothetical protein